MGDITIGSSLPTVAPQETVSGNSSSANQKPVDNSINDAKGIGLDFGKSLGEGLFANWIEKDHSLSYSLEHAMQGATKDLGKTAINVFVKQAAADPQSSLRFLLPESGEGYFSLANHGLFSKPGDNNQTSSAAKPENNKPQGFDVSVGFPKLNLTPNGSFLNLATKPSPANIKEFSIGDKIELSYGTSVVDFKLGVEAEGSLAFQGAKHWSSVNKNLFQKEGQGSVTPSFGINVHPNQNFNFSLEAGTQFSSKVSGPDNHRSNTVDTHLGVQLTVNLPGGTNEKKEEILRKENPPKDSLQSPSVGGIEIRWVNDHFKIDVPAPEPETSTSEPEKPVQP